MTDNPFLKRAYRLKNQQETLSMYGDWAATYDQTMKDHEYQSPRRIVEALLRHCTDKSIAIFDVGCGTGLSGMALAKAGFTQIDGSDVSPQMIEIARQLNGVYRRLTCVTLDTPFPFAAGAYHVITAMGVIADKHAPPQTIGQLLDKLHAGGLLIFSLNNHTLENPDYMQACHDAVTHGVADILEDDDGPHMVGLGMTSKIMVLRKS